MYTFLIRVHIGIIIVLIVKYICANFIHNSIFIPFFQIDTSVFCRNQLTIYSVFPNTFFRMSFNKSGSLRMITKMLTMKTIPPIVRWPIHVTQSSGLYRKTSDTWQRMADKIKDKSDGKGSRNPVSGLISEWWPWCVWIT